MVIVVKIGTNTLTDITGKLDKNYFINIAKQISTLINLGKKFVIVSSGAIGAGSVEMGIEKPRDIPLRQAMASIGQSFVMKEWHDAFEKYGIKVSQILLTYDDFSNRSRFLNLKNALDKLLDLNVIPIMNENDPISINEIGESFGDNDKLSALISSKLGAEKLIILSDIDGFYDKDPKQFSDAKVIEEVDEINFTVESMCGGKGSKFSVGGMETKLNAIKIANASGVPVVLCNGNEADILNKILSNIKSGTIFNPHKTLNQKKLWIKEAKSLGKVYIDDGAFKALIKGKNLLPAGILKIEGNFDCDAIIEIYCDVNFFAKAIIDYSSDALLKIIGKKTSEIDINVKNVIKRENLVIL